MEKDWQYVYRENKMLRRGYTTGSCAAAAAKAAALLLFSGKAPDQVSLVTPKGVELHLAVEEAVSAPGWASCAICKDSGDDPDSTDGVLIHARLERSHGPGILVDGGVGVGRVTKPGLACAVGEAAINPVPRQMIVDEVRSVCAEWGGDENLRVVISVPEGEKLAARTYNPRLGIVGGISILGTTGIVEPMSDQALVDSIRLEMQMLRSAGKRVLVATPGNYGETFARETLCLNLSQGVQCSNFVGKTLDMAVEMGFEGVLLIGHLGKFVKLAAGIMNTHSHCADGRMEILAAHAGVAGAEPQVLKQLLEDCVTTDEAMAILDRQGLREEVMKTILQKVDFHLKARVYHRLTVGAVLFSSREGFLGQTQETQCLLERLRAQEEEGTEGTP